MFPVVASKLLGPIDPFLKLSQEQQADYVATVLAEKEYLLLVDAVMVGATADSRRMSITIHEVDVCSSMKHHAEVLAGPDVGSPPLKKARTR